MKKWTVEHKKVLEARIVDEIPKVHLNAFWTPRVKQTIEVMANGIAIDYAYSHHLPPVTVQANFDRERTSLSFRIMEEPEYEAPKF